MADSYDAPHADSAPTQAAPPESAGAPQPLQKAPRANPATVAQRHGAPATEGTEDISLEELLIWARTFDETSPPPAEPPSGKPKAERSQIAREKRKFRKFDPEAAREEPQAEAAGGGGSAGQEDGRSWDDEAGDDPRGGLGVAEDPRRGLRRPKEEPRSFMSSLAVQGVVLVLMAASFLLGHATVPAVTPIAAKRPAAAPADADKTPSILPAAAMDLIDRAIAAENAGDSKGASALFDQLRHSYGHIDGLDYHVAWLCYRTGDSATAVVLLNQSIAAGEHVGGCYGLRGLIALQQKASLSLRDFETATQADPFDGQNFFFWGEQLRRSGKLEAALVHLQQALARAQSVSEQATDALKVRLTQIELGQGKELDAQIDTEMALPRPPAEWVLTAAAREMQSGNYPAAAVDLNLARQIMEPKLLAQALRDYYFLGFAEKPALKPVFVQIFPPSGHPTSATAGAAERPLTRPAPLPLESPSAVLPASPPPTVVPSPTPP